MILLRCYAKITDWVWVQTHIDLRWVPIQSYGFMVACGFMAAAYVITKELQRREKLGWLPALSYKDGKYEWTSELVGDFVILCAIFGILGSSLFNFLESPGSYRDVWEHPSIKTIISSVFSGLSVYGGMICAGISLLIYGRRKGIRIPHLFDSLALCFILAVGIGRLGCELAGDADWGISNTAPKPAFIPQMLWANTYEHNIANVGVYMQGCNEEHCMMLPEPAYPTPIYEFIECSAICLILYLLRKRLTDKPGMLFMVFAVLIGVQRYSIEQIRSISDRDLYYIFGYGLKQAELISIILVIVGIGGIISLSQYYKRYPAVMPPPLAVDHSEETITATSDTNV